ncbi:unnamed protein product [marine sediment metagenome]|uniref:Uncharacterized protein n=1 Tax=marine sediment metagenome TaxID=412755 RepID=X1A7I4_9ZZZZ
MCKDCKKNKFCVIACYPLSRVLKKDLTHEEWKRVRAYEATVHDDNEY